MGQLRQSIPSFRPDLTIGSVLTGTTWIYRKLPVYIPDEMHIDPGELPLGWEPGSRTTTRLIGDHWLAGGRSVVLQVPSAVVVGETNFVLNPTHRDMHLLEAGPVSDFRYDQRLGRAGNNIAGGPRDGTSPSLRVPRPLDAGQEVHGVQ